ncbi:MAG TPA: LysR substrate-binding domain-containing protein [Burkholderiaceae bacterium]|nr:LysR substrate-binding domain-containing protein [Burkholderiaceae bacterium]
MDLRQLEYFVRVAELGSFTRAAVELDVAQPALSRQVRLLEVELRQPLLVRNGRGAVPTEAGKVLLEHGRGILHQVQRASDELNRLRGGLSGRVAVGMPSSVARVLAVPLTRSVRAAMPDAQLTITEGLSAVLQEGLASGRLDIAVLYNQHPSRELDIAPLLEEDLLLVRARPAGLQEDPPPGRVELNEVAQLRLVIPSRPNAIRMHVESAMAQAGFRPTIALEIDAVPAILDLVLDGAGCAILSRNALLNSARPSAYTAQQIGSPPLRIALSLATSLQRPATPTQRTALELIRKLVPQVVARYQPA